MQKYLIALLFAGTLHAQTQAGIFVSPSAGLWEPLTTAASFGALSTVPPTSVQAYCQASAGAAWTPCVFGGSSGPTVQTGTSASPCSASSITNYAPAVCVFTLSAANLLQFDGTSATVINVIGAPGSGKMLSIIPWAVSGNYIAGSHVYPASVPTFDFLCGSTTCTAGFNVAPDVSQTANQISAGTPTFAEFSGPTSSIANKALSVYATVPVTPGIATSTLDDAGTLWAVGDTFNDSTCGSSALGTVVSITGLGPTGPIATYTFTGGSNFSGSACAIGTGDALVAVSPSTGTGASINVTGLTTPGNGTVVLTIPYTVVPVS